MRARAVFPVIEDLSYRAENHLKRAYGAVEAKLQLLSRKILAYIDKRILGKTIRLGEKTRHIFSMSSNQNSTSHFATSLTATPMRSTG
jgi:hypothetical protein